MNLSAVIERLEVASFSERESLAETVAPQIDGGDRQALLLALRHEKKAVRLGVVEILARARDASMVEPLLAHARSHEGDDRVFALRALCRLARPGDEALYAAAVAFCASPDPFTQAQAQSLLRSLGATLPAGPVPGAEQPVATSPSILLGNLQATHPPIRGQSIELVLAMGEEGDILLLRALLECKVAGPRIDLACALEGLPFSRFVAAAGQAFAEGNGDVVALLARALIRHRAKLSEDVRPSLRSLLEAARRRLARSPLASAALDDALSEVVQADLPLDLWPELIGASDEQLRGQVKRWLGLSADDLSLRTHRGGQAKTSALDRGGPGFGGRLAELAAVDSDAGPQGLPRGNHGATGRCHEGEGGGVGRGAGPGIRARGTCAFGAVPGGSSTWRRWPAS